MNLGTIVKVSFIVSFILTIFGTWLKITHSEGAQNVLAFGVIATIVFVVAAIYEVRTSPKIDNTEKTLWTLAFIFFSGIAGLIYFIVGRRRIVFNS